jgi:hypothetical protein
VIGAHAQRRRLALGEAQGQRRQRFLAPASQQLSLRIPQFDQIVEARPEDDGALRRRFDRRTEEEVCP